MDTLAEDWGGAHEQYGPEEAAGVQVRRRRGIVHGCRSRCPMFLKGLECPVSKFVNSDALPTSHDACVRP